MLTAYPTNYVLGVIDDSSSIPGMFFKYTGITAGSVFSYSLDLMIDKIIYVPPPTKDIVIEKDKKQKELEDKIQFRKDLYDAGLSDKEVEEDFAEKYDSSNVYQSIVGRSLEKAYKTNSLRSLKNITTVAVSSGAALTFTSALTSVLLNPANEYFTKDATTGMVTFVKAIGKNENDFQMGLSLLRHVSAFMTSTPQELINHLRKFPLSPHV